MRVLVAGSHGMIGSALVERLRLEGHDVVRLVRRAHAEGEVSWDPRPSGGGIQQDALEGFDAIVHVGGASIGERRWSEHEKQRLWDSRVASTEILTKGLVQTEQRPKVFVCASAVGYYGSRGEEELTEESAPGEGFLATLVQNWEDVCRPAAEAGIRVVNTRSGIVLSPTGGALARQLLLFRLCLGGRLGPGRQWMSWIALEDEVRGILHAISDERVVGPVNLMSPNPVRNATYTSTLGAVLRRPALVPAPRWMIALAMGAELTDEVILASQRAYPEKLLETGFDFALQDLDVALIEMLVADREQQQEDAQSKKRRRGRRD